MSIKFAVRGTALTAYKHSGAGKTPIAYNINAGGVPALAVDAGAIGGSAINYDGSGNVRGHIFPGFDNSTKTGIISILARIAPTYSGSPASNSCIMSVSGAQHTTVLASIIQLDHLSNGNLVLTLLSPSGATSQSFANMGAWSPVSGQYYDIVITWDGTTAANGIKIYIDGTLFAQATSSITWAAGALHTVIGLGVGHSSQIIGLYKLNEYVLWDAVIDPTSGGLNLNGSARSAFVTVTGTLDPTNSTDPGIANVRTATSYIINGVSFTGTLLPVTNILTQATLIGQAPPAAAATVLRLTQGDDITLNLKAIAGADGDAVDLTGAVFTTYLKGADGSSVIIDDADHTADADQVTNPGVFTCRVSDTKSALLKIGAKKEIVTKVVIASDTIFFHGIEAMAVISASPSA